MKIKKLFRTLFAVMVASVTSFAAVAFAACSPDSPVLDAETKPEALPNTGNEPNDTVPPSVEFDGNISGRYLSYVALRKTAYNELTPEDKSGFEEITKEGHPLHWQGIYFDEDGVCTVFSDVGQAEFYGMYYEQHGNEIHIAETKDELAKGNYGLILIESGFALAATDYSEVGFPVIVVVIYQIIYFNARPIPRLSGNGVVF